MPRRPREPTPGPGHYDLPSSTLDGGPNRPTAAFRSRTRRDDDRRAGGAAPGQYDPDVSKSLGNAARKSFNASSRAGASSFIYRARRGLDLGEATAEGTPAPGDYDPKDPRAFKAAGVRRASSPAFVSRSQQRLSETAETPGAGAYDPAYDTIAVRVDPSRSGSGRGASPGAGRGTAAFASRDSRFNDQDAYDVGGGNVGPGSYDTDGYRTLASGASANMGKGTATFKSRSQRSLAGVDGHEAGPGPGSYDWRDPRDARTPGHRPSASFASSAKRMGADDQGDTPGVGAYDPQTGRELRNGRRSFNQSARSGVASFGSRSRRGPRATEDPTPGPTDYDPSGAMTGELAASVSGSLRGTLGTSPFKSRSRRLLREESDTPGAGAYDPQFDAPPWARGTSAAFKSKDRRFGEEGGGGTDAQVGPGTYDVEGFRSLAAESVRRTGSAGGAVRASATFRSRSARLLPFADRATTAPGPGDYDVHDDWYDGGASRATTPGKDRPSAAFASGSRRMGDDGAGDVPGPGAYDVGTGWRLQGGSSRFATSDKAGRSGFGSSSGRRGLPFSDAEAAAGPGPGAYDPDQQALGAGGGGARSAFGSRSLQRGRDPDGVDGPGAGAYDPFGSVSVVEGRGTTAAFRSKDRRFREEAGAGTGVDVGPGTYDAGGYKTIATVSTLSQGKGTATFKSRSQRSLAGVDGHEAGPGPGSYDWRDPRDARTPGHRPSASFASSAKRMGADDQGDTPGVGAYDPQTGRELRNGRRSFNQSARSGGASFGSRSRRGLRATEDPTPGPTDYDPSGAMTGELAASVSGSLRGTLGTSPFKSRSRRLGREESDTPGAGAYDPHSSSVGGRGTSTAFKSKDRRFREREEGATGEEVGPGLYDLSWYKATGDGSGMTSAFKSTSEARMDFVHDY